MTNGDGWGLAHFGFLDNLKSPGGTVAHRGDEPVGSVDSAAAVGAAEEIEVDLKGVAPEVDTIVFPVSVHEAEARRQNSGLVSDAHIRIINQADEREPARYDLTEEYRHTGGGTFRAIGQGSASGLRGIALDYGVNV